MKLDLQDYRLLPSDAKQRHWDIIIIGSGMGGGTTAHALALKGYKTLIIEKGQSDFSNSPTVGVEIETKDYSERLFEGRWPTQLTTNVDGYKSDIWAPLGCGLGGSTLLYAAALSRLEPLDFAEQVAPNKKLLRWPFTYQELEPYYQQAENLYCVSGTSDPLQNAKSANLAPPPKMAEVDTHFYNAFKKNGLNPYNLHVGVKYIKPDCSGCGGHLCGFKCKQDTVQSCILPALKTNNLWFIDQAEVLSIDADRNHVNNLTINKDNVTCELTASTYVLAAGGYFSPVLLQQSCNSHWPNGLANDNDLVGRNLMFHASENIAIWPRGRFSTSGPRKTIALRDFYKVGKLKLGELQSTGFETGYGNVLYFLRTKLDQSWLRYIPFLRQLLRIPAYIASKLFKNATVFAGIIEDFPYLENRIVADKRACSGMRIEYTIHEELKQRVKTFRKLVKKSIKSHLMYPMSESLWLNYGHPCGTCVAGKDPETSVVNENCKVHKLSNLYIADASIMPTSGGTNPSLTIAAVALRVADAIDTKFNENKLIR